MTHAYYHKISVEYDESAYPHRAPRSFVWRGTKYRVLHLNSPWHLQDRWWLGDGEENGKRQEDRWYFRFQARGIGQSSDFDIFGDLYHEAIRDEWVLATVFD